MHASTISSVARLYHTLSITQLAETSTSARLALSCASTFTPVGAVARKRYQRRSHASRSATQSSLFDGFRVPTTCPAALGFFLTARGAQRSALGRRAQRQRQQQRANGVTEAPGANIAGREPPIGKESNGGDHRPPVR